MWNNLITSSYWVVLTKPVVRVPTNQWVTYCVDDVGRDGWHGVAQCPSGGANCASGTVPFSCQRSNIWTLRRRKRVCSWLNDCSDRYRRLSSSVCGPWHVDFGTIFLLVVQTSGEPVPILTFVGLWCSAGSETLSQVPIVGGQSIRHGTCLLSSFFLKAVNKNTIFKTLLKSLL